MRETPRLRLENAPTMPKKDWKKPIAIAFGVIFGIVLVVGILWFLMANPAHTATIRDIIIIMSAFVSVIIGVLLAVLVLQLQWLIGMLRNEIKPLINTAQETAQTVRGTTEFVSDNIAKPTIKVASFMAGLRGAGEAIRTKVKRSNKG
jgi:hypothetical protein